jgi:peptidoglycan/LPS O-acetylase OafA/YrhL
MVDLLKVMAAQIILWHHFCRYGPLARTLDSAGQEWVSFIGSHGRHAVQVFLVISGFLAVRSIRSFLTSATITELARSIQAFWCNRIWRLGKPYWLMLVVAITFAALTRTLQPDVDTPATPNAWQIIFHFLFLQDIFAKDALSTGVWYVAIDLQLSLLFLCILLACGAITATNGKINPARTERFVEIGIWILMLIALFGFNRWRSLDIWAIYFFGSFGLGAVVAFRLNQARKNTAIFRVALTFIFATALTIEWRAGLLVALISAALLWWANDRQVMAIGKEHFAYRSLHRLSSDSYALFLFHYPIVMLLGAMIDVYWPRQVIPAMLGLAASWVVSMLIAFGVTRALKTKNQLQKSI